MMSAAYFRSTDDSFVNSPLIIHKDLAGPVHRTRMRDIRDYVVLGRLAVEMDHLRVFRVGIEEPIHLHANPPRKRLNIDEDARHVFSQLTLLDRLHLL